MKTLLSLLLLPLFLSAQTFQWAKFPGNDNLSCGVGIATDAAGNCYTQGILGIMKFDLKGEGKLFWKGDFQKGNIGIETIATDNSGNLFIAGSYSGEVIFGNNIKLTSRGNNVMDIFIAKINPAGICQWAKTASGGNVIFQFSVITRIATDATGNCFVTGKIDDQVSFGGTTLKSNGRYDLFIGKYNANGDLLWVKQIISLAEDVDDYIYGIICDAQGNCYITGAMEDAGQLDNYKINKGAYIAKLNADGKCIWVSSLATAGGSDILGPCFPQAIGLDANANAYITGYFHGNDLLDGLGTPFLMKVDGNGKILWAKHLKGKSPDAATSKSIIVDKNGNSYIAGSFKGALETTPAKLTSYGKEDLFIARYDNNGELKAIIKAGGPEKESADVMCMDNNGNIFVSGQIESSAAKFGSLDLNNINSTVNSGLTQGSGPFVAKYKTGKN